MPRRVLLRGGHVLSMDPKIGDLYGGDVLVEDDRIAAVGHALEAADAETVDATGCIVIPGFVDSHRPTGPRTCMPGTTSARSRRSTQG